MKCEYTEGWTLGKWIQEARGKKGDKHFISLGDLADKIKTGPNRTLAKAYLSSIENGNQTPSPEIADQIAKVLGLEKKKVRQLVTYQKAQELFAPSGSTITIKEHGVYIVPKSD
jgi:transcriptional regulator with XRE-family HTH domain